MAPEGLVVVPTAELAQQVAAVASRLAAGLPSAPCVLLVSTAEELEAALEWGRLCVREPAPDRGDRRGPREAEVRLRPR